MHYPINASLRCSHGLSASKARKTKSSRPKGPPARSPAWRAQRLLVATNDLFWNLSQFLWLFSTIGMFHISTVVQRWIHVNDRCKNFISFYNRSRIKLSETGKGQYVSTFSLRPFFFLLFASSLQMRKWQKRNCQHEYFRKDFWLDAQKMLDFSFKCRNYFICIRFS